MNTELEIGDVLLFVNPYVAFKRLLRINPILSDRNTDKSSLGESGSAVC